RERSWLTASATVIADPNLPIPVSGRIPAQAGAHEEARGHLVGHATGRTSAVSDVRLERPDAAVVADHGVIGQRRAVIGRQVAVHFGREAQRAARRKSNARAPPVRSVGRLEAVWM